MSLMSEGVFGKKIGMTHIFDAEKASIPVTLVKLDVCQVSQIKTCENDGYNAIQVAYNEKEFASISKPIKGHLSKSGTKGFKSFGEFRVPNPEKYDLGQTIDIDSFSVGQKVKVSSFVRAGTVTASPYYKHRLVAKPGCKEAGFQRNSLNI